jgi:peptidoglycan/LPS O-acetylase OafA/YrhL
LKAEVSLDVSAPPVAPTQRANEHIPVLDGVRGVAISLVLLHHFGLGAYDVPQWPARIFTSIAMLGWCGVDLFFVLSGFLITGILFDSKDGAQYFKTFYMRRILRIFPLYYGALTISFLVLVPLCGGVLGQPRAQLWLWIHATSLTPIITGTWFGVNHPLGLEFGHFWSLSVEEHFYFVWPLVIFLFSRRSLMRVAWGVICCAFLLRVAIVAGGGNPGVMPYLSTPCRMDALAAGGLLALLARGERGLGRWRLLAWWLLLASALGLIIVWSFCRIAHQSALSAITGYSLFAALFACLMILVMAGSKNSLGVRFFSSSMLRFLGKYSYGLYVLHGMLTPLLGEHLLPVRTLIRVTGLPVTSVLIHCLACSLLCVGLAWLSWHLFEKHFLKLKRYFNYDSPKIAAVPLAQPSST